MAQCAAPSGLENRLVRGLLPARYRRPGRLRQRRPRRAGRLPAVDRAVADPGADRPPGRPVRRPDAEGHPRPGQLRRDRSRRVRRLPAVHGAMADPVADSACESSSSASPTWTDIPVPGDYDGTGRTELAVFRPKTGQWIVSGPSGARVFSYGSLNLGRHPDRGRPSGHSRRPGPWAGFASRPWWPRRARLRRRTSRSPLGPPGRRPSIT